MKPALRFISIPLILAACSCASKSQKEAQKLYEEAQANYQSAQYEGAISKITRALELTDGGKPGLTIKFDFYNGSIRYLRGQAYEALGKDQEALEDYTTAITQGNEFLSSRALNSRPEPYAKNKFMRNKLANFYQARGRLYRKVGQEERAEGDLSAAARLGTLPTSTRERVRELLPGQGK